MVYVVLCVYQWGGEGGVHHGLCRFHFYATYWLGGHFKMRFSGLFVQEKTYAQCTYLKLQVLFLFSLWLEIPV